MELVAYLIKKDTSKSYNWDSSIIKEKLALLENKELGNYNSLLAFKKMFNTKRVGLQYYVERGWTSVEAKTKMKQTTAKRLLTEQKFIERYGDIDGKQKWVEFKNKSTHSESSFIERYGYIDGKQKWVEFKNKLSNSKTKKGYIEKYGEIDGNQKWLEKNIKISNGNSLKGYILKYGDLEGKKKWLETCKKKIHDEKFYISKYGDNKGKQKWLEFKNKSSKSLVNFQRIYGIGNGIIQYELFKKNHKFGCSLDGYKVKHGVIKGTDLFKQKLKKMNSCLGSVGEASKESLDIFNPLSKLLILNGFELNKDFFYGSIESTEFSFDGDYRLYDFAIISLKLIFEYNGSHVHPSKTKLTETEWNIWKNPFNGQTADEKYNIDLGKIDFANKNGYEVTELWDYNSVEENLDIVLEAISKKISL